MKAAFNSVQSARRGFTLTEIAIVLGVVGLILAGIWAAASAVIQANRVNTLTRQINEFSFQVRNFYGGKAPRNFPASGSNIGEAIGLAKAYPQDMRFETSRFLGDNGSFITLSIQTLNDQAGTPKQTFSVNVYGLSQEQCVKLSMAIINTPDQKIFGLRINDVAGGNIFLPANRPSTSDLINRCQLSNSSHSTGLAYLGVQYAF